MTRKNSNIRRRQSLTQTRIRIAARGTPSSGGRKCSGEWTLFTGLPMLYIESHKSRSQVHSWKMLRPLSGNRLEQWKLHQGRRAHSDHLAECRDPPQNIHRPSLTNGPLTGKVTKRGKIPHGAVPLALPLPPTASLQTVSAVLTCPLSPAVYSVNFHPLCPAQVNLLTPALPLPHNPRPILGAPIRSGETTQKVQKDYRST